MRNRRLPSIPAPVLDALCLLAFVAAGRQSHGIDSGAAWFLAVLWPIVLGWFAVAVVARLYVAGRGAPTRLAATIAAGVAAGLVLRIAVTHRATPPAFILVAYGFVTLTTVGWRLLGSVLPRLVARRR